MSAVLLSLFVWVVRLSLSLSLCVCVCACVEAYGIHAPVYCWHDKLTSALCHHVLQLHDNSYDVGRALQALVKVINPKSADRRWSDDDAVNPKFYLARHVSTRHDTFDMSSASCRAYRAVLFAKLDTAKMHGLDTSNVSWCRVVSRGDVTCRDEPSVIWA